MLFQIKERPYSKAVKHRLNFCFSIKEFYDFFFLPVIIVPNNLYVHILFFFCHGISTYLPKPMSLDPSPPPRAHVIQPQ